VRLGRMRPSHFPSLFIQVYVPAALASLTILINFKNFFTEIKNIDIMIAEMHKCPTCQHGVEIERVHCSACGLRFEGRFALPRLARLAPGHQHMAEMLVLCAGNLKEMASALELSYPTVRKRLDALVDAIQALRAEDDRRTQALLDDVEAGTLRPEAAARLIKEMSGDA